MSVPQADQVADLSAIVHKHWYVRAAVTKIASNATQYIDSEVIDAVEIGNFVQLISAKQKLLSAYDSLVLSKSTDPED